MRTLFNPRPSPGGRSPCVEPTSIYREARPPSPYLHGLPSRGLAGLPLRPDRAGSACPAASGSCSAGRPPPESLPARNGVRGGASPRPALPSFRAGEQQPGPSRSQGAPCRPKKEGPLRVGGSPGPELPRRRPAEEAGRASFHGPVTLPLLFRLCCRLRGEAKTWRPPKSVGVAGGRASGPKAPSLTKPLRLLPGRGAGRPAGRPEPLRAKAPSPTAAGAPPSPAGSAGQNKQHSITKNTAKLDRETEELHHDRVPLEVGKVIQQGRQNNGLTQKDLATVSGRRGGRARPG